MNLEDLVVAAGGAVERDGLAQPFETLLDF